MCELFFLPDCNRWELLIEATSSSLLEWKCVLQVQQTTSKQSYAAKTLISFLRVGLIASELAGKMKRKTRPRDLISITRLFTDKIKWFDYSKKLLLKCSSFKMKSSFMGIIHFWKYLLELFINIVYWLKLFYKMQSKLFVECKTNILNPILFVNEIVIFYSHLVIL